VYTATWFWTSACRSVLSTLSTKTRSLGSPNYCECLVFGGYNIHNYGLFNGHLHLCTSCLKYAAWPWSYAKQLTLNVLLGWGVEKSPFPSPRSDLLRENLNLSPEIICIHVIRCIKNVINPWIDSQYKITVDWLLIWKTCQRYFYAKGKWMKTIKILQMYNKSVSIAKVLPTAVTSDLIDPARFPFMPPGERSSVRLLTWNVRRISSSPRQRPSGSLLGFWPSWTHLYTTWSQFHVKILPTCTQHGHSFMLKYWMLMKTDNFISKLC